MVIHLSQLDGAADPVATLDTVSDSNDDTSLMKAQPLLKTSDVISTIAAMGSMNHLQRLSGARPRKGVTSAVKLALKQKRKAQRKARRVSR